jgi:hypothetical protein
MRYEVPPHHNNCRTSLMGTCVGGKACAIGYGHALRSGNPLLS